METLKRKNLQNINKLNDYISANSDNISDILVSPEMFELLKTLDGAVIKYEDVVFYKNIKLTILPYSPAENVNFVLKTNVIKFELPCSCGFYESDGDFAHKHNF